MSYTIFKLFTALDAHDAHAFNSPGTYMPYCGKTEDEWWVPELVCTVIDEKGNGRTAEKDVRRDYVRDTHSLHSVHELIECHCVGLQGTL